MSWLGEENEEYLRPFVERLLGAHRQERAAGREKQEAEQDLLDKMLSYELEEIRHGEWRILVDSEDDGGVIKPSLTVVRRNMVDLS